MCINLICLNPAQNSKRSEPQDCNGGTLEYRGTPVENHFSGVIVLGVPFQKQLIKLTHMQYSKFGNYLAQKIVRRKIAKIFSYLFVLGEV